jgi:signal transduction histidine kinase
VLALATHVRRAWEALGAEETAFELTDRAERWLAVADPDQLDQVLWALLDNAVRHGGGARVSVTIERSPRDQVRVRIADDGPGVLDVDRVRMFERYARGTSGSGSGAASGQGGTGLGLYVSRELCRAMRGDLVLEPSVSGAGATFSVLLPGEPPEDA